MSFLKPLLRESSASLCGHPWGPADRAHRVTAQIPPALVLFLCACISCTEELWPRGTHVSLELLCERRGRAVLCVSRGVKLHPQGWRAGGLRSTLSGEAAVPPAPPWVRSAPPRAPQHTAGVALQPPWLPVDAIPFPSHSTSSSQSEAAWKLGVWAPAKAWAVFH